MIHRQSLQGEASRSSSVDRETASAKRLLTIVEASRFLGCSRANVYALVDAGELPVISVGRSRGFRVDRQDLEAFIERRKIVKAGGKPTLPTSRPRLKHIRL